MTIDPERPSIRGSARRVKATSEKAEISCAIVQPSFDVLKKSPVSSSRFAKAIACTSASRPLNSFSTAANRASNDSSCATSQGSAIEPGSSAASSRTPFSIRSPW